MGTFTIVGPTSVSANSFPAGAVKGWGGGVFGFDDARPLDNASLLAGINSLLSQNPSLYAGWTNGGASVPTGSWLCRFGFGHADLVISLDGNPNISFNELPAGIRILTATLKIDTARYANVSGDVTGTTFLQQGTLTESSSFPHIVASQVQITRSFAYDFSIPGYGTFLNVINDGFGIRCVFANAGALGQYFMNARIEGTYDIVSNGWTLETEGPVHQGDEITIVGDGTNPLTDIEEVCITFGTTVICFTDFITQTPTQLTFVIPGGVNFSGGISLTLDEVFVGSLIYVFEDGSGIYVLTRNKSNDTLYNGARDGTTRDVKIPNPIGRTGFIGG